MVSGTLAFGYYNPVSATIWFGLGFGCCSSWWFSLVFGFDICADCYWYCWC